MSKFATKAAANMFCQARYEAAKSNERLSSREGAAEEIGIDRTRLARIELGSTIPYQEEVLLMADCYKAPELKGNYCREMCPLGKNMPKIENAGLDRISLRMLSSLKKINEAKEQTQRHMLRLSMTGTSPAKEIKEYGTVKTLLPEAGALERAGTYRDKKVKPLFIQMKNKIAAMAAQVKELTKEVEKWKNKYQKTKQAYNSVQKELDDMRKDNQKLLEEKNMLQSVSDRYDRVVRVMGIDTVEAAVLQDIHNQKALEEKRRMEQMPKGSIYERLAWGAKKSEMENQQRKKNKTKNRGMEI